MHYIWPQWTLKPSTEQFDCFICESECKLFQFFDCVIGRAVFVDVTSTRQKENTHNGKRDFQTQISPLKVAFSMQYVCPPSFSVFLFLPGSSCRCEMNVSLCCVTWLVANWMHTLVNQTFCLSNVQFTCTASVCCFHFSGHVILAVEVQIKSLVHLPKDLQLHKQPRGTDVFVLVLGFLCFYFISDQNKT